MSATIIPRIIDETIENEMIVLDMNTRCYFSFNTSAALIWSGIKEKGSLESILEKAAKELKTTADLFKPYFNNFINLLEKEGLIQIESNLENITDISEPERFEAPLLEKFDDMQEFYISFSPALEYNIHNTTIEGRFFVNDDPHTEKPIDLIYQNRIGLVWSWVRFDLQIFYYRRTPDVTPAIGTRSLLL